MPGPPGAHRAAAEQLQAAQHGGDTSGFQRTTGSKGGAEKGETGVVACDHCLEEPQPALKTCLVCEAFLCRAHLSKHNARRFHQEHVLVEVAAGRAEERRCPDHGRLLECYCLREEKCICILCSVAGAHKSHEVVTMKKGRDKQLVKLSDTMTELQDCRSDLVIALEELQESENQIKINAKTLISELKGLFQKLETKLHERKTMILSDILSNEEEELAVIAKMRKKMEQKRDQTEWNLQALQKIEEQPDIFLFFKELKLVTDRIARLNLEAESVRVEEVELDDRMFTPYETQEKKFLMQLDNLLEDVRDKLPNLSGVEQDSDEEQHLYCLKNLFENSGSARPRQNGDVKNRCKK